MQLLNTPAPDHAREIDQTRRLVESIAHEVWLLHGANGTLNWDGVESHLARLVEQARRDGRRSRLALDLSAAAPYAPTRRVARRGYDKGPGRGEGGRGGGARPEARGMFGRR